MRLGIARCIFAGSLAIICSATSRVRGQETAPSVLQHKQNVDQALKANDRVAAEHEYREILRIDSQNSEAWTGLGILLYGSGRTEQASKALQSALDIDPNARRAELFLGLSESDLRDCLHATPILSKYFSSEAVGTLQRLTGLALVGCTSSDADALPAQQTVARLKQLYPSDADVLYASAELYTRLWNENAAELLAKHPDSYRVHQLAGEVYEAQKNYDQAIREYFLALAANSKLPEIHFRIGQLYLSQGFADADEKAMEQFRLEKANDLQSAVSSLAMAEIYRHQHKLDDAKRLYEEASQLDPRLIEARVGLAQTLLAQHQTDAAFRELDAVITEKPENASAHYALMLVYRQQGKMIEAAAEMATFKQLQGENDNKFQNQLNALLSARPSSGEILSK